MLPLRSVGRSNFDKGLHSLTTLIKKRHTLMRNSVLYIYIYMWELTKKTSPCHDSVIIYIYMQNTNIKRNCDTLIQFIKGCDHLL